MSAKDIYLKAKHTKKLYPQLRLGQNVMNILNSTNPKIFKKLVNTDFDCFYDDEKIFDCLFEIERLEILELNKKTKFHNNLIDTWQQGYFVDKPIYSTWVKEHKEACEYQESLKVILNKLDNPICNCNKPEDSKWISSRLNLAAQLERVIMSDIKYLTNSEKILQRLQNIILKSGE